MTRQRNQFLDFFRGIAIIIVVLGHAIQICYGTATQPVHSIIQTFQMSLLFIISGFSSGFAEPMKDAKRFLIGKVKRILLPYLVWSQLNYLLGAFRSGNYRFISQLKNVLVSQFWFLRILFLMFLIYWIFVLIYRNLPLRMLKMPLSILAAIVFTVAFSQIPGCNSLMTYIPFFVVGNMIYKLLNRSFAQKYRSVFLGVSVLFSILFVASIFLFFKTDGILQLLIDKSMAFSGAAACFVFCRLLYALPQGSKLTAPIEKIGKNTLPVYAIHWCILFSLPFPLYGHLVNSIGLWPSVLIVTIVWLFLCGALIYLLRKIKIARNLLLGEK